MTARYVDTSPSVPRAPAERMLEVVEENDPMKPWTLVKRVNEAFPEYEHQELRVEVLKPLTIEGVLTPNADGEMRPYKPELLGEIVSGNDES